MLYRLLLVQIFYSYFSHTPDSTFHNNIGNYNSDSGLYIDIGPQEIGVLILLGFFS